MKGVKTYALVLLLGPVDVEKETAPSLPAPRGAHSERQKLESIALTTEALRKTTTWLLKMQVDFFPENINNNNNNNSIQEGNSFLTA